jgi:general secretion pathway protein G
VKRSTRRGFTLVEILVVVIILGILAAIVITQVGGATGEARLSNLVTNLKTVRSQVALYRTQHRDANPGSAGEAALFGQQMMHYTDADGAVAATPDATHTFGPYLQAVPANPFSGASDVTVVEGASDTFTAPGTDGGWWFNRATGEVRANLRDSWTTTDGTRLNAL